MNAFNDIIKENFGVLSEEEMGVLRSYFVEEKMNKNEFFLKNNQYCKKLSLIKSGLLRLYRISEGREITQWISTPGYFITEIPSFFFNQPSRIYIQALTDVELLTINQTSYSELNRKMPKWKEIESQFITKCFAILEDRVFAHLSMNAEERYNAYFEENRQLFNQVPLQYLASILGMSPETFSRIRKKQMENS